MPVTGLAQSPPPDPDSIHFEHYTTAEGLSSTQIRAITQDKFGFIWIATSDGLNRFDGRQFTQYRHLAADSNSLLSNIINSMVADSAGKLWLATNKGLCYYEFSDDRFHSIDISRNNGEQSDRNRVYDVIAGKEKKIWYSTLTELHLLEPGGTVRTFDLPLYLQANILSLAQDDHGRIWIGTNKNRVVVFDPHDQSFNGIPLQFNSRYNNRNVNLSVTRIYQKNTDTVLIGSWYGGLQQVIRQAGRYRVIPCPDPLEKSEHKWIVPAICRAFLPRQFWVATYGNGLALYDQPGNHFVAHLHHRAPERKSLCSEFINAIYLDASGILWVGTDDGLDKYDTLVNRFSVWKIPSLGGSGLGRRHIVDIIGDVADSKHNSFWLAVPGQGLLLYDLKKGLLDFYHSLRSDGPFPPGNSINSLFQDHSGVLWIGAKEGIYILDRKRRSFNQVVPDSLWRGHGSVSAITEDCQKRMWFATYNNGLYRYDPRTKDWVMYRQGGGNGHSIPDDHVFCVFEDDRKRIWIGTQNQGLCRLDEGSGKWTVFRLEEGNNVSLPDNNVYSLLEDKDRRLWIATENGLAVMSLKGNDESIRTYTVADGLCNNDIFGLAQSPDGHLWLATNNGLSDFDPSARTFKNYYSSDGLPGNSLNEAFRCLPAGNILLGAPGEICSFNAGTVKTNKRAPAVVVTSVRIFDKEYPLRREGLLIEPVRLSYKQNMISLHFAALNFTNASGNKYAYKLEGFDKDWIFCGNGNSATYTNLDGGSYTFRVKASNNDGVWNETGASVKLEIRPPFRKTWWFYLLVMICVATAFYTFYRVRLMQLLQLQKIRTDIARDLHDDIGSTLSSISMMSRMAAEDRLVVKQKPAELLGTIARASQQAMDLMGDIIWSVNPVNDKFENILIRMREYAGEILDAADISLRFEVDERITRLSLPLKKRKDFLLIFKEAVNNLAKYSHAGLARIRISAAGNRFVLVVEDDGTGFDPGKNVSGNGLKNMAERAASLGAKLTVVSGTGSGTTISLDVPFIP
jgi:ligand-binding sensor domain-containing protein/signal transduction histidine kinase